jgi:hypothetical protein
MPQLVSILACLSAAVPPLVSVLACLSAATPAVKELLVVRLDSPLEDIRVKVGNFQSSMPPLVSVYICPPPHRHW